MLQRFQSFVTGVTQCYKSIQKIKATEMTEFGLKGTHVMCLFYLSQHPEGLTAAQLSQMCAEDKAAISRTLAVLQERDYIQAGEKKYRAPLCLTLPVRSWPGRWRISSSNGWPSAGMICPKRNGRFSTGSWVRSPPGWAKKPSEPCSKRGNHKYGHSIYHRLRIRYPAL